MVLANWGVFHAEGCRVFILLRANHFACREWERSPPHRGRQQIDWQAIECGCRDMFEYLVVLIDAGASFGPLTLEKQNSAFPIVGNSSPNVIYLAATSFGVFDTLLVVSLAR
jgi:hypothetical protein